MVKKFVGKLRSDKFHADVPGATAHKAHEPLPPQLDEIRSALVQGARLRCSRCRGFGHIADDCTVEDVAPVHERCFKCGEAGHMARQCSKKGSLNAFAPGRQEMREFKRMLRARAEEATTRENVQRREGRDAPTAGKVTRQPRFQHSEGGVSRKQVTMEDLDRQLNHYADEWPQ
jgi:hypothetical protein